MIFLLKRIFKLIILGAVSMVIVVMSFSAISTANISYIQASANIIESPVLIIDPGHGGEDGGAVSNGGVIESGINLDISLKMRDFCALFGISPVMTRNSETIDYPEDLTSLSSKKVYDQKSRVELINSYDNAVLVSIHQNIFPSSKPFGAQVLYSKNQGSSEFAENLQKLLVEKIDPENYRVAAQIQDTVYLMKNVNCPAILIECGFLSNPSDEAQLQDPGYQLKLAMTFASSYFSQFIFNQENYA